MECLYNSVHKNKKKNPVKYKHIRPLKFCVLSIDTVIPEYGKDHLIRINHRALVNIFYWHTTKNAGFVIYKSYCK